MKLAVLEGAARDKHGDKACCIASCRGVREIGRGLRVMPGDGTVRITANERENLYVNNIIEIQLSANVACDCNACRRHHVYYRNEPIGDMARYKSLCRQNETRK